MRYSCWVVSVSVYAVGVRWNGVAYRDLNSGVDVVMKVWFGDLT